MAKTLYSGPAKVYYDSTGFFPEGENGMVNAVLNAGTEEIAVGLFGRVGEQQSNLEATITLTPADNWGILGKLYPAYLGAKVGATSAGLLVGTRPHGASNKACKIWSPDGRLYEFCRAAVVRPPDMHLGVGKALFGEMTISAIGDAAKALGAAGFLFTHTESAAQDPGGQFAMTDFVRGAWTGAWGDGTGVTAGFGGGAEGDPMEAEEEWTISCEAKFKPLPVQKLVRAYELTSVGYMVRVRPYGPTHTQIMAATMARALGERLGTADLVLTGPSSKTITLKNCEPKGAGFSFGGTQLGTGEIGFVNQMTFSGGAPAGLIEFSA